MAQKVPVFVFAIWHENKKHIGQQQLFRKEYFTLLSILNMSHNRKNKAWKRVPSQALSFYSDVLHKFRCKTPEFHLV